MMRNRFIRIIFISSIVIGLSLGVYWGTTKAFVIRVIEVQGDDVHVSVDEKRITHNLVFFPSDRVRTDILKENGMLADVTFIKKYPNTLVIVPKMRKPYAQVQTPTNRGVVDREGIVLEYGDMGSELPIIQAQSFPFQKGHAVSSEMVLFALQSMNELQTLRTVREVIILGDGGISVQTDKEKILLSEKQNLQQSIATLQTLLAGFRIKGKLPAVVDLRFDKPVVQF